MSHKEAIRCLTNAAQLEEIELPEEVSASAEVRDALDSVQIEAARLQQRKIQLAQEQVEDSFRQRAAARGVEANRAREEQARHRAAAAGIEWRNEWLKYAQDRIPRDASPALRIQVNDSVADLLDSRLSPTHPKEVVVCLIDAALLIALEPYHREQLKREVVDRALCGLPQGLRRNDAMDNAKQIAHEAIDALGHAATESQMKAAAADALKPLLIAFQHGDAKRRILDGIKLWRWLDAARPTEEERTAAVAAVSRALQECAPGTPESAMEKVKQQTLTAFDNRMEERLATERRRKEAERSADRAIERHLDECLGRHSFVDWGARQEATRTVEQSLRPVLIAQFLDGSLRGPADARRAIEKHVGGCLRPKSKNPGANGRDRESQDRRDRFRIRAKTRNFSRD